MAYRTQSDPLMGGSGRVRRLLDDARAFTKEKSTKSGAGAGGRPTLAQPSRPFTPREDVRGFYPTVSSLSRMKTPTGGLGITLTPLSAFEALQGTPPGSPCPKNMPCTPLAPCPPPHNPLGSPDEGGADNADPYWLQLQGLLPLLDASSSDDVLRDALDKVLRITQNIKVVEHAGGTLVVEKVDKRLRPAIGRLEKLQNQAESSVIKIKAAEIILMAAPGGLFYASQCHQLYKLSKEAANDVCFRGTGAARSLLAVISHPADVDMGARTLAAAALTHITEDKDICRSVAREDEGIAVLGQVLHRTIDNMVKSPANPEKNVNFLIQVTSCLRNLSEPAKHAKPFAEFGVVQSVMGILKHLGQYKDLVLNAARILAKLSLHHECRACIHASGDIEDVGDLKHILTALNTYHTLPAIVDRLCFTLGNLTHTAENNRVVVMQKLDALPVVVRLLETQMEADQQLADVSTSPDTPTAQENGLERRSSKQLSPMQAVEGALIRILRLIGNLSINREAGAALCAAPKVADALVSLVTHSSVADREELVMNAVACITNLSYYEIEDNSVIARHQEVMGALGLLVLHDHPDVVHESVKAFGNFSRTHGTRTWMIEKRIDEAMVILLDHSEVTVVTAVAGVLMNFSADPDHMQLFTQFGAMDKLLELFQDFNAQASHESLGTVDCILKIFCNLLDLEFFKDESRAAALHGRVQQLAANLSEALPAMPSLRGLADLTQSALQAIADQWPQLQSVDELEELLQPPGQA
mmetsp:Transcript_63362/g.105531  ORF Transcript_63362/g.105531 Transcript_63362/m.105531 type:complete len:756 (-) Transcript_63362:225-2492(-)